VAGWFRKAFAAPSPAQVKAWPAIRRGDNTLLLAPTGSGKTLAAFLCAIDELWRQAEKGDLAEGIQVLYISPLKALGNDIHKNLLEPLAGIRKRTRKRNLPEIRVAVRTGDTSQSERAKMIRRPPHILITTPESLYILLSSKRMAPHLASIRTVIVDEVHALCDNKRGVHLAVSLERLEARLQGRLQRVGCSATLSPLEEIAAFLAGRTGTGRQRPCKIIDAGMRKNLDVQVRAPLPDFLEASNTALWSSAYELLLEDVRRHNTSLIFTNSRYKAERTSLRLAELCDGKARIGAHHGSMSKEVRLEVEDDLKSGRLDALVATASLELGIDIGAVDMVYQLESPKSMATGLQRIGRAGHLLDATSKGRILCFERDELLEAAAICRSMIRGEIDAVRIPRGCLDVLAQQIAGAVAARDWQTDELFGLIRRAYPYRDLPRDQFDGVVTMLAGELPFEMSMAPRPLLMWDRLTDRLSASRSAAHVSVMCAGTIPESSEYDVFLASRNKKVGTLEGGFVDDCLRRGDVFVLGSSSWRVVGVRKNRLLVEDAPGSTPTVPWWLGPIASRTTEVGARVGELRREVASRLGESGLADWLQKHYHVGPHAAAAIIDYVREQQLSAGLVPDEKTLLIETWRDELGRLNVIVHSPLGSRINKTWGVAVAAAAKKKFRQDWSVVASNDVLLLTRREPRRIGIEFPRRGGVCVSDPACLAGTAYPSLAAEPPRRRAV
jgi:ATP-dependent Lhr-like helicase